MLASYIAKMIANDFRLIIYIFKDHVIKYFV